MQKLFALLISGLLAACQPVLAEELEFNYSGFATYTHFSDEAFYPSEGLVALNLSASYGNWAVKTQVANTEYEPIRRLALEYSTGVLGDNVIVQVGRIPRLATMESDVYGSPAEWGMSVLPMAGYNRRKVHSIAFQTIEGVKVIYDKSFAWGNLRTLFDVGTSLQERDCEWQYEFTRRCNKGFDIEGDKFNNYDLAFEAKIGASWTALMAWNKLSTNTYLIDPNDPVSVGTVRAVQGIEYWYWRTGLRYDQPWGYIQAEHGEGRFGYKQKGEFNPVATARDDYLLGMFNVTESVQTFIGYARGQTRGSPYKTMDRFFGVNYRWNDWTFIAERHTGIGAWGRSDLLPNPFAWRSNVFSATYTF